MCTTEEINHLIRTKISIAFGITGEELKKYSIHRGSVTDFQFNQINALAKFLNLPNNEISKILEKHLLTESIIQNVKTTITDKQIFISFNIEKTYLENMVNNLFNEITKYSLPPPTIRTLPKTVLVDFSSPNIAKEMHVGHLRSTIIGESLCRIFEYCGSNVKRVNHIGDWGTQFGMLIAYIKQNAINTYELPQLMAMYKESRKMFESDPEFKKNAYLETVKLQQGSEDNILIWKNICQISMESFNKIYEQLKTHSEVKGESFYQSRMIKLVEELEPIIIKQEGMKVLFPKGFTIPYILVKSDGGFTYDTSDLAAAKYRLFEEKTDEIIYVIDSGQQQHLQMLFQIVEELGWAEKGKLKHAGFGLVLGPDGKKLKTRSGETVKLQDLLDQATEHSKIVTTNLAKERHPDWTEETITKVSTKIAINCIKYADLCNPRLTNYKFNAEKMLNLKGNTAVYLMYGLARCKAIIRKIPSEDLPNILNGDIIVDSDEARNLVFKIIKYKEAIMDSVEQLAPHYLCNYLYELDGLLTKYYDKNRCINFDADNKIVHIYEHRVRLIYLVIIIMNKFFDLIGLEHIEQI